MTLWNISAVMSRRPKPTGNLPGKCPGNEIAYQRPRVADRRRNDLGPDVDRRQDSVQKYEGRASRRFVCGGDGDLMPIDRQLVDFHYRVPDFLFLRLGLIFFFGPKSRARDVPPGKPRRPNRRAISSNPHR